MTLSVKNNESNRLRGLVGYTYKHIHIYLAPLAMVQLKVI